MGAKWVYRTDQKHRANIKIILECSTKSEREKKQSEFGCRYSCLVQLPYFDMVRMVIIDLMHNLYLGTAKHLFSGIWVKRDMVDNASLKLINERILSLLVPPQVRFSRLPPYMHHSSSLTAEQWMLWVNYYSIFCLYEIIPSQHLDCWRHFVLASRLLCKKTLTSDDIKLADALLLRFCLEFQSLYGEDSVTPNIHLHAHLADCVQDYGPMSSFWLFSFERFNGILGDEPTNNRSIEVQLMSRFMADNCHLTMLSSLPSSSKSVSDTFTKAVLDHACSFTSTKHLDSVSDPVECSLVERFVPATKYTFSSFSGHEMEILHAVYLEVYPSIFTDSEGSCEYFPQSFRKMTYGIVDGQKVRQGHYILARNVFQFSNTTISSIDSAFSLLDARPALIDYIFMHSVQLNDIDCVSTMFAAVSWPMFHHFQHCLGKPYEIWCLSAFETCNKNFIVPLSNFVTLLLTAEHIIHEENVLITVPLIL